MLMDQELKDLFSTGQCPTGQELLHYLDGRSAGSEKRRIEIHLVGCSLCSDALEGLSQVQPPARIPLMVSQVNERIKRHLKGHSRSRRKQQLYILLSLTVFIVLVIILVAYMSFHFASRNLHPARHAVYPYQNK